MDLIEAFAKNMATTRRKSLYGGIAVAIACIWFALRFLTTNYTAFPENTSLPLGSNKLIVESGWPLAALSGEIGSSGFKPGKVIIGKADYSGVNLLAVVVDLVFLGCLATSAYAFGCSMDYLKMLSLAAFLIWLAPVVRQRDSYISDVYGLQPIYWTTQELTPAFVILTCFFTPRFILDRAAKYAKADSQKSAEVPLMD